MVDSYYSVAEEAIFLIVALKNVIAFGFSYSIVPWTTKWGIGRVSGVMAGLLFGCILLGFPLYLYGKWLRVASAKLKVIIWQT